MYLELDTSSLVTVSNEFARAPEMVIEEMMNATVEAQMLLEAQTKELTPVGVGAAGGLCGNIQSDVPQVLGDTVIGMVGSTLNYAEAVELGRKPGKWVSAAGVESIADWARYKLGISAEDAERMANAVAWKIHHHGTQGKFMFTNALAAQKQAVATIFKLAAGRITQRLGNA